MAKDDWRSNSDGEVKDPAWLAKGATKQDFIGDSKNHSIWGVRDDGVPVAYKGKGSLSASNMTSTFINDVAKNSSSK